LLAEVQKLVRARQNISYVIVDIVLTVYWCCQLAETLSKKTPPNRDAEILKALEALLVPPKRVAVIDRLHEYKVLTARAKTPVPARTVPVLAPVPKPAEEEKAKCVEVQTEPLPVPPRAPTPPPVQAPDPVAAPQPVIIHVPVPAPAAAPAPPGLERELIELMRSVVDTQHQTMQGNQALILSLIHERSIPPAPEPEYVEEEVIAPPTPPKAPTPPPAVVEPPPAPVQAPLRPAYSTAFGSVVLGAGLMEGPYATPPTIVPPALQPCVLRGVPLPRPGRGPVVAVPAGPLEGRSDPDIAPPHHRREGDEVIDLPLSSDEVHGTVDIEDVGEGGDAGPIPMVIPSHTAVTVGAATQEAGGVVEEADQVAPFAEADAGPSVEYLPAGDDRANIGLSGAGTASTAGRGGASRHSAPGSVHHVHPSDIPPHMRRVASEFTMRALRHPYRGDTGDTAAATDSEKLPVVAAAASAGNEASEAQPLLTLLQNLHTLTTGPVAPLAGPTLVASALTPEAVAIMVSEGVQRGVKEALGLIDTHSPHLRPYYSPPHGQQHSARHKSLTGSLAPAAPTESDVIMLSATEQPDDAVRDSLQLLKSRRGCGRNTRAVTDLRDAQQYDARNRRIISRNMPHPRRQENDVRDSTADYDREGYGMPRTTKADVDQQRMDRELRTEIENSRLRARKLLDADENSSFNDSVSLDEETAAYLRDPLTHNLEGQEGSDEVASSSDLSLEAAGEGRTVRLVHRTVHDERQSELFSNADNAAVRADLPQKLASPRAHATAGVSKPVPASRIVPLVSRVLQQSATEEVLHIKGGMGAFNERGSIDSANSEDNDAADPEADLWDMNVSALHADRPSPPASAGRDAGPGAGLKLLKKAGGALDRRTRAAVADHSPASSVSIMTRSAESSSSGASASSGVQRIPTLGEDRAATKPGTASPLQEIPYYSPHSSQSSEDSQLPYKRSGRPSLLPRYSYAGSAITAGSARKPRSRSSSRGRHVPRSNAVTTEGSDVDAAGDTAGTERLAAQMMLNVLELHRPDSYTTRPHLANPIGARYRSKICAADSDKSGDDASEGSSSVVGAEGSGLDVGSGSSVSSGGELLDGRPAAAVGHARGGARLLGVGSGAKLLSIRK
jgi:hypothetical protein